jgi:capsular polysaccharide biosynthesis protein
LVSVVALALGIFVGIWIIFVKHYWE